MYSLSYTGTIVMFVTFVCKLLGVEIGNEAITTTVETIATLIGAILAFYGRYRAGGITALGAKIVEDK